MNSSLPCLTRGRVKNPRKSYLLNTQMWFWSETDRYSKFWTCLFVTAGSAQICKLKMLWERTLKRNILHLESTTIRKSWQISSTTRTLILWVCSRTTWSLTMFLSSSRDITPRKRVTNDSPRCLNFMKSTPKCSPITLRYQSLNSCLRT